MKNKTYYLHGYHRLVYCHDETEDCLVLGGMCEYFNDARTNIMRQQISKENFLSLKPIEISENLNAYPFLTKNNLPEKYAVTEGSQITGSFLKNAIELPSLPIKSEAPIFYPYYPV